MEGSCYWLILKNWVGCGWPKGHNLLEAKDALTTLAHNLWEGSKWCVLITWVTILARLDGQIFTAVICLHNCLTYFKASILAKSGDLHDLQKDSTSLGIFCLLELESCFLHNRVNSVRGLLVWFMMLIDVVVDVNCLY